jgi:undecaprenyl-diphosphatase
VVQRTLQREGEQRVLEPRADAEQEVEPGARHLRPALDVDAAEQLAELEVIARRRHPGRGADLAQHDVVVLAAGWHAVLDDVGYLGQALVERPLGLVGRGLRGLDLRGQLAGSAQQGRALVGGGGRHLLAVRLLLRPQPLEARQRRPARLVGGEQRVDPAGVLATGPLGGAHPVGVVAEQAQVDHRGQGSRAGTAPRVAPPCVVRRFTGVPAGYVAAVSRPTKHVADAAPDTPEGRLGLHLGAGMLAAAALAVAFVLLALLVLVKVDWLQRADQGVADALHRRVASSPRVVDALVLVQEVTQPWRLYLVSAVVLIGLVVRQRHRLAMWLLATSLTGWFLGYSLKLVVQRARPTFDEPLQTVIGYSFPSGHALNSVIFAGTMALLLDRVVRGVWRVAGWIAAVGLVLLVGFDRVAIGAHYLSDVFAGWVVGTAVLVATVTAFRVWRRHEPAAPGEDLA